MQQHVGKTATVVSCKVYQYRVTCGVVQSGPVGVRCVYRSKANRPHEVGHQQQQLGKLALLLVLTGSQNPESRDHGFRIVVDQTEELHRFQVALAGRVLKLRREGKAGGAVQARLVFFFTQSEARH